MVRRAARCEQGATLVIFSLVIVVLMLVLAIVIDLGATRSDRRTGQSAVDNAAAAAGQTFATSGAVAACQDAIGHLEIGLDTNFAGYDCSTFATCPSGTGTVQPAAHPDYELTLHHPVPDTSPLMGASSTIGANASVFASDRPGLACERIGIELTTTGGAFFGQVAGEDTRKSTAHSVVLVAPPDPPERLINLAVLERIDCDPDPTVSNTRGILSAEGQGKVSVAPVVDGALTFPGLVGVDSDGTGAGCPSVGTLAANGGGAVVRADGPAGCPGELATGPGHGCGEIQLFASGAPGCNAPACTKSGTATVAPTPSKVESPITRAPIDHRYNCKASYAAEPWYSGTSLGINGQPIGACTTGAGAYIDQLVEQVDAPGAELASYQLWSATHPCGDITTNITVSGNWHVDCDLVVKANVTFTGGNAVFDGDLIVTSSTGALSFNQSNPNTSVPATTVDAHTSSQGAAFVYLRGLLTDPVELRKDGQATVAFNHTMIYVDRDVDVVSFDGGTSTDGRPLTLTAPTQGPFRDLAVWSETIKDHGFAGQANFSIEGALFAPLARIDYAGQSDKQIEAQFVARALTARGQGLLTLKPTRGVRVPRTDLVIRLIR